MSKKRLLIVFLVLTLSLIVAIPAIVKAIPPRYAARLPEPLRQLNTPKTEVAILPTVAAPVAAESLLGEVIQPTATLIAAPPTPTPIPVANSTATLVPTFTPQPSPVPTNTAVPLPAAARLDGFRHQFQTWNNCGPATMAMTLSYFGLNLDQKETAAFLKPNPEDRNVSPHEMAAYVNSQTPYAATFRVNGTKEIVKRFIANGIPVILEIGIEPPGEYRWLGWYGHYLLVVAYDDAQQQFWVYDSWFGTSDVPMENATTEGRVLTYADVDTFWPHFNRNYIAVYRPEQADLVAEIIGENMDDDIMWQNALVRVQAETAASPNNAFNWFNLGTIYNALGRYEEAATAFDQARAIGLPWRMLWYQFGPYEAYYQVGRYEDVILLADVTLKDRPYFEESFYYKGLALAALGDMEAARDNLQKAAEFNPNFTPAVVALETIAAND
ncbi:MAG: hypothetical protein D6706_05155 [Chloroflexi bacterium]|nr:MAG: hypothetical protein D6706_05155 [Chloroflexota bacterium]